MKARGRRAKPFGPTPFLKKLSPQLRRYLKAGLSVNFPPQGFDPLDASDEELKQYYISPAPDKATEPRAFALWRQAMAGPLTWPVMPEGTLVPDSVFSQTTLLSNPRLAGPSNASFESSSANWSGAYARPEGFGRMKNVRGLWTVPTVTPPVPGAGAYASSAWVGLDGHDPASRSLVQIGSGQWVTADAAGDVQPAYFAWWQWFVRDGQTNGQVLIKGLPIAPGDLIYAQVDAVTPTMAWLLIVNLTTKAAFPFAFGYVGPIQPLLSPTNPLPAHIEGQTADWILERPAHVDNPMLYTLPDYTGGEFLACCAATHTGGLIHEVDFHRARMIRMVDWQVPPTPSSVVSTPSRDGTIGVGLKFGP